MSEERDTKYLQILLDPICVSAEYKPKFGQSNKGGGLSLEEFQTLYQSDPFYSWFGLDNPLMYAAHKAAGGMTSAIGKLVLVAKSFFVPYFKTPSI